MKSIKKLLCLLSAMLLIPAVPIPAAAEDTYSYTVLNDGTISVICKDTSIVNAEIPAEIDGYTVSALAEDCFNDCAALQTVTFPDTLVKLDDYAFHGCESITSITIPAQVTEIGSFVFEGCTALTEILVADGNADYVSVDGVLYESDMDVLVRYPAAKTNTEYTIPENCTVISPWAFTDCSSLLELNMTSVTAIGADAFFCATSLESVTLSEGITELIGPAFAYCTNMKSITLPSTLQTIGDKCFYGCVSLQSIELPDGLLQIGEMAFYGCVQVKEMVVPASVVSIGEMGIGYSVDPDTNENAVIEGFEMKTVSGSKASAYARRNKIRYSAKMTAGLVILWIVVILLVLAAAAGGWLLYRKKQKEAQAALEEAARKLAEKRARRRERRNRN